MRGRVTDKSSILLLGRNSVVFGAIVIFVLSMGIGYFLGYKGSGFGKTDKQALEHGLPLPPSPSSEDKKIVEPSSGNAPVLQDMPTPPAKAPAAAEKTLPGPAAVKNDGKGPAAKPAAESPAAAEKEKAEATDIIQPEAREGAAPDKPAPGKYAAVPKEKGVPAPRNTGAADKAKKGASAGKVYAIQLGAFPSKEGALQLQSGLKGKGVKTYLVNKTKDDPYYRVRTGSFRSRKEAEHGSKALEKKTGLHNFVTLK